MINTITDKDRLQMYISVTKITIVLCWLSLFAFWAIKLFGGNWFEIMVENENFVKFSDAVQNTWLKYLVSLITIVIGKYMTFGAICQKFVFKGKQFIIICLCILSIWAGINFINSDLIKMWYAYILMLLIGLIYQSKWKKTFGLIAIAFDLAFSGISLLVRNIPLEVQSNYMVAMIISIDVYIMYGLYFLHLNLLRLKKEK